MNFGLSVAWHLLQIDLKAADLTNRFPDTLATQGPPKPAPEGLGALQQPCRVRAVVSLLRGVGPCELEVSRRLGSDRANRLNQALEGAGRRIR